MKRRYLKLVAITILLGALLCAGTYADKCKEEGKKKYWSKAEEVEREVTEAQVPAAALAALKKLAAGAKITEFAEEIEHGHTFYEGSWKTASGAKMDVLVTPTGDLVEIEERVSSDNVPAAVLKAAQEAAGADAELKFEKKTMILYEVKFRKVKGKHELLLTPDGRRVKEEVEKGKSHKYDKCKHEKKVSIDDVPEAVRATILKHAKGGEIKEVEQETKHGKTIYEAEVIIMGKEVDIKVAEDGKLLGKETDENEDEDEGNDDDDDEDD